MYYDKFIVLWQAVQSEMPHVGLLSAWTFPFTCLAALPQRVLAVAQRCALLWQGPVLAMLAKKYSSTLSRRSWKRHHCTMLYCLLAPCVRGHEQRASKATPLVAAVYMMAVTVAGRQGVAGMYPLVPYRVCTRKDWASGRGQHLLVATSNSAKTRAKPRG